MLCVQHHVQIMYKVQTFSRRLIHPPPRSCLSLQLKKTDEEKQLMTSQGLRITSWVRGFKCVCNADVSFLRRKKKQQMSLKSLCRHLKAVRKAEGRRLCVAASWMQLKVRRASWLCVCPVWGFLVLILCRIYSVDLCCYQSSNTLQIRYGQPPNATHWCVSFDM